ncbi:hypothetical protein [Microbulbifer sp. S227A]|uniref:hypothetical protein n=1 Tax=Microbulbifer sp. S227A TaxID=3415131 RepID=UPI003C7D49F0
MSFSVSPEIYYLALAGLAVWIVCRWILEPRARRGLTGASPVSYPQNAGKLVVWTTLRQVGGAIVLAAAVIFAVWGALSALVPRLPESDDGLSTLVTLRAGFEEALAAAQSVTVTALLVLLGFLALVWLFISYRATRSKWSSSIETRRADVKRDIEAFSNAEVRTRAKERCPAELAEFQQLVDHLVVANTATLDAVRGLPVMTMGQDDAARASINDLEEIIRHMSEAGPDADEAGGVGEVLEEEVQQRADVIAQLQKTLDDVKSQVRVPLMTLHGEREVSAEAAEADLLNITASADAQASRLREIIADAEVERQEALASSSARSEPELYREWAAAFATGETAVKGAGLFGRLARVGVTVVLMLGLVGVGAQINGPMAIDQLRNLELSLGSDLADQEFAAELEAAPSPSETAAELASDAETVEQLSNAMRQSVVLAMQAGHLGTSPRRGFAPRQRFDLSAVGARQEILRASTRVAPTRASSGAASATTFRASTPSVSPAVSEFNDILDASIQRRIDSMRAHEPTWRQMRAAAARPASRDLVSQQFLRAVFSGERLPAPSAMRLWVDRATVDVARTAVRSGSIPSGYTASTRVEALPGIISDRDRRLFHDFDSRTPRNVATHTASVRSGGIDPGSLHRSAPNSFRGTPVQSAYARTFPTSASPGGSVSARSYTRIRFNRRVGGVVIGREPSSSDVALDIVGFDAVFSGGEMLEIALTPEGAAPILIGSFHPAIAHHALAYAADGRVVAATLPQIQQETPPGGHEINVPTRPVVVHPAFEDTAFACSAIEIDRFVDRNMFRKSDDALIMVTGREAVSSFARILDIARSQQYTVESMAEFLQSIQSYTAECGTGGSCFPIEDYSKAGLNYSGAQALLNCLGANTDVVGNCQPAIRNLRNDASYSVDSGVRELPYALDSELTFLRRDANRANILWPMDFIVQAVPVSLYGDTDVPEDLEPWVFPQWEDDLRALVELYVKSDPEASQILDQIQQFTVLQRLFRLALDGQLGLDFPIDALIDMQIATKPYVKDLRHEHWNFRHDEPPSAILEMFAEEALGLRAALRREVQGKPGSACATRGEALLEASAGESFPEGATLWAEIQEVAALCQGASASFSLTGLTRRVEALNRLNLIEEALSVHAASQTPRTGAVCPPL